MASAGSSSYEDFHLVPFKLIYFLRQASLRELVIASNSKRPEDVFPVEFSADPALFKGIVSGRIDGFYTFPLNRPFEIDRGERYLTEVM